MGLRARPKVLAWRPKRHHAEMPQKLKKNCKAMPKAYIRTSKMTISKTSNFEPPGPESISMTSNFEAPGAGNMKSGALNEDMKPDLSPGFVSSLGSSYSYEGEGGEPPLPITAGPSSRLTHEQSLS